MKIFYTAFAAAMFFSASVTVGAEKTDIPKTQASIEQETHKKDFEALAGEWFCYVIKGDHKNLLASYSYVLDNQGQWRTKDLLTGEIVPTGRFSILDGKLFFIRKTEAKNEPRGLEAQISGKNFLIRSALQPSVYLQFEKIPEKQLMTKEDIVGKWIFYQKVGDTERKSPFVVEFAPDGGYSVVKDEKQIDKSLSGKYEIKAGRLYLINDAGEGKLLWHKSSFFLDGGKLIFNNLAFYCFAEKE